MPVSINPETILRDLDGLWASLAQGDAAASGVLRACAMTLVVAAEDDADAQAVGETIAELMHEHPSRAIVLRRSQNENAALEARVFAQCWMPFGRRQQICCEEIEITTPAGLLSDIARVILGLIVPDLPVVLWCRGADWFDSEQFRLLFRLADKLILDSARFGGPRAALALLASLRHDGYRVGDLAWTRLTGWRELIAQIFDDGANRRQLAAISRIHITCGGEAAPAGMFYLGAWLQHTLPGAQLEFKSAPGPGAGVRQITLRGGALDVVLTMSDGATANGAAVDVLVGGAHRRAILPPGSDYFLMLEELSILGPDPVYEAVLPLSRQLAEAP
ncbi:MAG: glucose-6-phosphate dehydrogenase assembly protein OpcA [Bryobacteraceae bacterium]